MTLPVEERVERGETLAGLRFLGEETGGRIRLACSDNLAKYRPGDALRLIHEGAAETALGLGVTYASFDDRKGILVVERDPYRSDGRFDPSGSLRLDPEASTLIALAHEAVARVRAGAGRPGGAARVAGDILAGTVRCSADADARMQGRARAASFVPAFDSSQLDAFVDALASSPIALVQGPPGTGKTHVLARIVSALAARGLRVLVTAYTHRAVNHALRKVAEADPGLSVVKVGKATGADDLRGAPVAVAPSLRRLPPPDGRRRVVGTTLFGLKSVWEAGAFDVAVVDEAAQVPLAYAPCILLAAERFVLVGDHRQMGPIVQGRHDDPLAETSLFESVAAWRPPSLLRTTYRMNEGLAAFPSRAFYGGRLVPSDEAASGRFLGVPGGPFDALFDPERPAVLALVTHEGFRTRCPAEAEVVTRIVLDRLLRQKGNPRDVAVVSPYRAQLRLVRTLLRRGLDAVSWRGAFPVVDTVERIQGQERDLVVVSLVGSDPEYLAGEASEFFYSPNRLNVTITRARTKLIIVASPLAFEAVPADLPGLQAVERFRRLRRELPAFPA